jgi:hypothetical protein
MIIGIYMLIPITLLFVFMNALPSISIEDEFEEEYNSCCGHSKCICKDTAIM